MALVRVCECGCGEPVSALNPYPYVWRHIPEDFELPRTRVSGVHPKRHRYTEHELIERLREWADEHGRTPTKTDHAGMPDPETYAVRFGSWLKALAKAGLTPRAGTRGQKIERKAPARDAVFAAIDEGARNKKEIIEATGLPETAVRHVLYRGSKDGGGLTRVHHGGNDYSYYLSVRHEREAA
jgi:hypothetical protein